MAACRARKVPQDWRRAVLIHLPKKGDNIVCDDYRGISLLSVPGKVYTHVIMGRIKAAIDSQLLEQQCGFRKGRSCIDQIFCLREL